MIGSLTFNKRNKTTNAVVLSAEQFERELAREKVRSTRRAIPFCVLKIRLMGPSKALRRSRHLATSLLERNVRVTDSIGLTGTRRLAVLLTDTPEMGGRCVVDRLAERFAARQIPVKFHLVVHDSGGFGSSGNQPDGDGDDEGYGGWTPDQRKLKKVNREIWNGTREEVSWSEEIPTNSRGTIGNAIKRSFDIFGASVGLALASPVLLTAIAAIRWSDGQAAIFKQTREGQGGKPFTIYKLRTMVVDAESKQAALREQSHRDGPAFKIEKDPRVTTVGQFLRKSCLDELPQLWNVLRGDMSLVGPRPLPWHESRSCSRWQRRRLEVRPGLTCYWQIDKASVESFDDWMRLDLRYLKQGSLMEDMRLVLLTARVPMSGRGAE